LVWLVLVWFNWFCIGLLCFSFLLFGWFWLSLV
jgi:hypothetical protein